MDKIFEVWSIALSDGKRHSWGAYRTRAEAEHLLLKRTTGANESWAKKYHGEWWIEEVDTTGLFQIPPSPTPRELYSIEQSVIDNGEGIANSLRIVVKDSNDGTITTYDRNHPGIYQTFEPFRQGDRMFALISADYTCTSVLDLQSGEVVASENSDSFGFCPVGFYVPDWWDIHDGSILPGSNSWSDDLEFPKGEFGFVWGCVWGDDSSWKVQFLDLSGVADGQIKREERFGYLKLASNPKLEAKEFIDVECWGGKWTVTFAVEQTYNLTSGEPLD